MPTFRILRNALAEQLEGGLEAVRAHPFVVSCAACTMTMWSISDNALLDEEEYIICRSCAGSKVTIQED